MNINKNPKKQKGATVVEFAFIFPILFGILYATICYGYIFFLHQNILFANQKGTQIAISINPLANNFNTLATTKGTNAIKENLKFLNQQRLHTSFVFSEENNDKIVHVETTYDLQGIFPQIKLPLFDVKMPPYPPQIKANSYIATSMQN